MKNYLTAIIRNALNMHTVASLVGDIESKIDKLLKHAEKQTNKADDLQVKAGKLQGRAAELTQDASRAARIAQRFMDITA